MDIRPTPPSVDPESARVTLRSEGYVGDDMIMEGEATVRVPRRRRPAKG